MRHGGYETKLMVKMNRRMNRAEGRGEGCEVESMNREDLARGRDGSLIWRAKRTSKFRQMSKDDASI